MNEFDETIFIDEEVLKPRDSFDKYTVLYEIARGGMGVVYKCQEKQSQRFVAIKFLLKQAKNMIAEKRFLREAKAMGKLQHSNIIAVYNAGNYNGHVYIVMEFLEGQTLETFPIQDLSLAERVTLIRKVALALHYTHKNGIIHRDIKPSNIFIEKNNNPKIMDFGLAKSLKVDAHQLTQTGEILGTPRYMSPEQINGSHVNLQTDIYSLGSILFEIVSGEKMIQGEDALQIFYNIRLQKQRSLADIMDVSKVLDEVCRRATSKKHKRYKTMMAFAHGLDAFLGNNKFNYSRKIVIAIFSVLITIGLIYTSSLIKKAENAKLELRTIDDYTLFLNNSLLNREYFTAKKLLQEIREKFPNQKGKLKYLDTRILLGLKEYDIFHQRYKVEEFLDNSLCLLSIAEMYYQREQPEKVSQVLKKITVTDKKYVGQVSVHDMFWYLSGYASFVKKRNSSIHFAKILNPEQLSKEYPMYHYYLGIIYFKKSKLQNSFAALERAYHEESRHAILDAMINCVMKSFSDTTKDDEEWQKIYSRFELILKSINKHSIYILRIHYCLARIYYKANKKKLALYYTEQAIALGENKTEVFDFFGKVSGECLLNNNVFSRIVENSFFEYPRSPKVDIFRSKVFSLRKKYEKEYLDYNRTIKKHNRNKTINLLKEARSLEIQKSIIRSLPADPEIVKEVISNYQHSMDKEIKQLQTKMMNLQRYRLAYLYSQSDSQMYSYIEANANELFYEVFCNGQESLIMRFTALTVLLRVCSYSYFKKQQTFDEEGQMILDLLLYRNSFEHLDKARIERIWQWSNSSQTKNKKFIKTLLLEVLTYKLRFSLVSSISKNYLQGDIVEASYVYERSMNKQAQKFLISAIRDEKNDLEHRTYAYNTLISKINTKNVLAKNSQRLLILGLESGENDLAKIAIRVMINCGRPVNNHDSVFADKRVGRGIYSLPVVRNYLESFFLSEDWDLVKLSVRLWANLHTVNYLELQDVMINSQIPNIVRATCYFHFVKNNPRALLAHFILRILSFDKKRKSEYELFSSHLAPHKEEHSFQRVISLVKDNRLKLMIHRLMRTNMHMEILLEELNVEKSQHKNFAAIYIDVPINKRPIDFPITNFCSKVKISFLQHLIDQVCKEKDSIKGHETEYRQKLRQKLFKKIKDCYNDPQNPLESKILWMNHVLYRDPYQHRKLSEKWKEFPPTRKQYLAAGFYQSLRSIFFDFERREKLIELINRRPKKYFLLRESTIFEYSYSKYIDFLKRSIRHPGLSSRFIQALNYAILFDKNHTTYSYEQAIICREKKQYEQALELLAQISSTDLNNIRYNIEKIEVEQILGKTIDVGRLSVLYTMTNNRAFLKRIARIYEQDYVKKAQTIYQRLYMEDPYDKDCLQRLISTYKVKNSSKKHWQKTLINLEKTIENQRLPIK